MNCCHHSACAFDALTVQNIRGNLADPILDLVNDDFDRSTSVCLEF